MSDARNLLREEVKEAIVQALACFDSPSMVVAMVKAEFALSVSAQQVEAYDPTKRAGSRLSVKWRSLFDATRAGFLESASQVPIANRSVRLRALQRMAERAERQGNLSLVAKLLEQAAREVGGVFTNRVDHTSSDGSLSTPRTLAEFYGERPTCRAAV